MFRTQHNQRFNVDCQPGDTLYKGWEQLSAQGITTDVQYDSRCDYCYLGHAHSWQQHDQSILSHEVDKAVFERALTLTAIPAEYHAALIARVYARVDRRMKEITPGYDFRFLCRQEKFQAKVSYETAMQRWEIFQTLLEIRYPAFVHPESKF